MSLFDRLFGAARPREALAPLYDAVVAEARDPAWYTRGAAPDTRDGRFDMLAAVLSLALLRLEREGERFAAESALLTEAFVADMDGQLRQIGIGDVSVGKHIGKMMGALGGRLTAYREGLGEDGDLGGALARNLWRGDPPSADAQAFVEARLRAIAQGLDAMDGLSIIAGAWPSR